MKVTAREIEQRQMVLEVEVEDERVQKALDDAYRRIVQRINVPGFRRGRAPRPLVERMVGREALVEDAVEHLVPKVYQDALDEQQITPSGQPALEVTSAEPLQFKATVPLEPSVELGDYRSIEVPLEEVVVEQSEIDSVVDNLRNSHATWAPVERAVQLGDRVGLDVVATRGEQQVMQSSEAEFIVDPTGPEPMPGFSEQLLGMEPGQQRTFALRPPQPAAEADDAGDKPAEEQPGTDFSVTLHWVKEKQLPQLDEEFARAIGEKESVEALLDEIRNSLRERKLYAAREHQHDEIVKQAVERASVVAPPQLVESRAQQLVENMAATLDRQGLSIEQYLQFTGKSEDDFRAELLEDASRSLNRSLVLEAIGKAEGLEVTDAEVRDEIELAARGTSDPKKTVRQALARAETRSRIEALLRTRKATDWLLTRASGASDQPSEAVETEETVSESTGETNA